MRSGSVIAISTVKTQTSVTLSGRNQKEGQGAALKPARGPCPLDPHQRRSLWDGAIRVGCCSPGVEQDCLRADGGVQALDHPAPAQIAVEVACGDTIEAAHPLLEPAVVGVDVLNMEDTLTHSLSGSNVERFM